MVTNKADSEHNYLAPYTIVNHLCALQCNARTVRCPLHKTLNKFIWLSSSGKLNPESSNALCKPFGKTMPPCETRTNNNTRTKQTIAQS